MARPTARLHVRRCGLFAVGLVLLVVLLRNRGTAPPPSNIVQQPNPLLVSTVAISVSGASRSEMALRRFSDALTRHVIQPALATHRFDAFVWLRDDAAEAMLCHAFHAHVRSCFSRHDALQRQLLADAVDEAATIAVDHPPARYGSAWVAANNVSLNTLRMLHKLRGVEQLRRLASSSDTQQHTWVLRVRPDLELLALLALPAAHASAIYAPWTCAGHQLVSDQLLLLPAAAAAERLGVLYDPARLLQTARRSAPPSLYPERLMHHALAGLELRQWPASLRLVGGGGESRDAYAKLAADFAGCFARGST